MHRFLKAAIDIVHSEGFAASIGFARIDTIACTKLYANYNQFHHYPNNIRKLEPHKFDKRWPGIIGEFASNVTNDLWPELDDQSVLSRLKRAETLGYPLALPWSFMGKDDKTSWGDAEKGIGHFAAEA